MPSSSFPQRIAFLNLYYVRLRIIIKEFSLELKNDI
jgi:hypothetical protein